MYEAPEESNDFACVFTLFIRYWSTQGVSGGHEKRRRGAPLARGRGSGTRRPGSERSSRPKSTYIGSCS